MNIISTVQYINVSGKPDFRAEVLKKYSAYYFYWIDRGYDYERSAAMATSLTLGYFGKTSKVYKALRSLGVPC